jgi:hypothetical protein
VNIYCDHRAGGVEVYYHHHIIQVTFVQNAAARAKPLPSTADAGASIATIRAISLCFNSPDPHSGVDPMIHVIPASIDSFAGLDALIIIMQNTFIFGARMINFSRVALQSIRRRRDCNISSFIEVPLSKTCQHFIFTRTIPLQRIADVGGGLHRHLHRTVLPAIWRIFATVHTLNHISRPLNIHRRRITHISTAFFVCFASSSTRIISKSSALVQTTSLAIPVRRQQRTAPDSAILNISSRRYAMPGGPAII